MKMSKTYFRFDHPNDILIGTGRVVYEPAYEAWALPGGEKTKDRQKAEDMARTIDEITAREVVAKQIAMKRWVR
jgi:hypothetical protein